MNQENMPIVFQAIVYVEKVLYLLVFTKLYI